MALMSIQKAAETWGVSVYTVRRLAAGGMMHTVNVGRRRLISESEIARIVSTGVPSSSRPKPNVTKGPRPKGRGR
jgi:excisionase family DNA binding protein